MNQHERIVAALGVTLELTSTEWSDVEIEAADLSDHPEAAVLEALGRCQREVKGRLRLADNRGTVAAAPGGRAGRLPARLPLRAVRQGSPRGRDAAMVGRLRGRRQGAHGPPGSGVTPATSRGHPRRAPTRRDVQAARAPRRGEGVPSAAAAGRGAGASAIRAGEPARDCCRVRRGPDGDSAVPAAGAWVGRRRGRAPND